MNVHFSLNPYPMPLVPLNFPYCFLQVYHCNIPQLVNRLNNPLSSVKQLLKNIIFFTYHTIHLSIHSSVLSMHACIRVLVPPASWLCAMFSGLPIKQTVSEGYSPAWGVKVNHNISYNYFNSRRCSMLWSAETEVTIFRDCTFIFWQK